MKYIIFNLSILLILGIAVGCSSDDHDHDEGIAYWTCPMHPEIQEDEPGSCPICGMDLHPVREDDDDHEEHTEHQHTEREIEYWTCPMHPEIQEDEPGSCPICGMDLTPIYKDDDIEMDPEVIGSLRITPVQQQLIGVQYDSVQKRNLTRTVRTVGHVATDERRETEVTIRVSGYVEKTHVAETGVKVRRGDPLVTIYSPDLVSSQEDYLIALNSNNTNLIQRARERLRLLLMPESEIRRLEEKGESLLEVTLTAPFNGVVLKKNVRDGMRITPGMMLYEIVALDNVWLLADIYEEDLPFIREGQRATFDLQGRPGNNFEGHVTLIHPDINPRTRTLPVRIEVPNPDGSIRLDQYGWVTFHDELDEVLSVHRDAVLITGKRAVVFREAGNGRFELVEVHLGARANEYYHVLHGLDEGDRVVTSGRFFLDAESRLRGIGTRGAPAAEVHQH